MRAPTQITAQCPCGGSLLVKAPTAGEAKHILTGWTRRHHQHQETE